MQFRSQIVSAFHVVPSPFRDQSDCLSPSCAHVEWNVVHSAWTEVQATVSDGDAAGSYGGSGCAVDWVEGKGSGGRSEERKRERRCREKNEVVGAVLEVGTVVGQWD